MNTKVIAILLAALLSATPTAWAQDKAADEAAIAALRTAAQKDKRGIGGVHAQPDRRRGQEILADLR